MKTIQDLIADIRYSILNISQDEFIELMKIPKELMKQHINNRRLPNMEN